MGREESLKLQSVRKWGMVTQFAMLYILPTAPGYVFRCGAAGRRGGERTTTVTLQGDDATYVMYGTCTVPHKEGRLPFWVRSSAEAGSFIHTVQVQRFGFIEYIRYLLLL